MIMINRIVIIINFTNKQDWQKKIEESINAMEMAGLITVSSFEVIFFDQRKGSIVMSYFRISLSLLLQVFCKGSFLGEYCSIYTGLILCFLPGPYLNCGFLGTVTICFSRAFRFSLEFLIHFCIFPFPLNTFYVK